MGLRVLVEMARQENIPRGTGICAFVMAKITQLGDAGVRALVDKGGGEALVKMARQENTQQGINYLMRLMLIEGFRNEVIFVIG